MKDKIIKEKLLKPNLNYIIEGHTLKLKPISFENINKDYIGWLNDPEANRYLEIRRSKQTYESVLEYINNLRRTKNCELFAIFKKNNEKYIGTLAITEYDTYNDNVVYGILIGDKKARLMGLGGEAITLIIEFLFKVIGARKVWGGVIADNYKSVKTVEFLGFRKEGSYRKHHKMDDGTFSDEIIYGIFKNEWEECKKKLIFLVKSIKITKVE